MTTRYVAIDTETTGLNPEEDEIIEVAAIAFDLDGVVGEFERLVKPRRLPSYQIERLTGIEAGSLESAEKFGAIAEDLTRFIGDSPIIGQSVGFDLAFLGKEDIWPSGPPYDTFDLAQLLLPGLHDYSLRGIADHLQIDFPVRHRAKADAEAARRVFLALRSRLAELPGWMLHEIERLAVAGEWAIAGLVREVLAEKPRMDDVAGLTADLLATPEEIGKPLNGTAQATGGPSRPQQAEPWGMRDADIDVDEVVRLLREAGSLPQFAAGFERRPEQEEMASAVTTALTEGRHLVVEAGTGTGKSLAYLLPAALQAIRRQQRVVVSTDTIGLQEQLIEKDLPVVKALAGLAENEPLRVASLKGRRNYLCLQRWTTARHMAALSREEAQLHARLLVWLTQTQTGDRAELNLHSQYDAAWGKLAAENTACIQTQCPFVKNGTCFLMRARKRAEAAHLLVVNHALLLSDVATGGHVLPPYDHVIIDEAHNLEDEATSRFAFRATEGDVTDFLDRIGRPAGAPGVAGRGGIAGSLTDALRGSDSILAPGAYLSSVVAAVVAAASKARARLSEPFALLSRALRECSTDMRDSDERLLVTRGTRVQPVWSDVEISAENLDAALADLLALVDDLQGLLAVDQGLLNQDALVNEVTDLYQIGLGLQMGLSKALLEEDRTLICWLERTRHTGEVSVCTAPLEVAEILRQQVFGTKESVVLTSATLSAEGRFDFLRERVGLDEADELLLGSPFDFPNSTLIALPTNLPDPNEPDFVASMSEALIEACRASQGRALVLFTSYGMLNAAYDAIKAPLEAEGILVLAHGTDGSPRQMLAALRENQRTVLLGTASFWEGVDVAGEALSLLVIVKLPFAVPTDPIYQARSQLYDEPFDQYALPQAVLRFRQGFGRLIRTKTDRGVLVVLDGRIRGRRYGEAFLKSLPRCTLREMMSRELPGAIEGWLGRPSTQAPPGQTGKLAIGQE